MTISALSSSTPPSSAQDSSTARKTLSSNFDTFLTLLTAQLSNQDPLNPVDSSQFTQQLVQYSQVEQQIQTNDKLKSLLEQNSASNGAVSVSYLGKTAVIDSAIAPLKDGSASWSYTTPRATGAVSITVQDSRGKDVFSTTKSASSSEQTFTWDGKDGSGRALADGAYTLKVSAQDSSGAAVTPTIHVNETITGIDFSGSTPQLITAGGERTFNSLLTIRN